MLRRVLLSVLLLPLLAMADPTLSIAVDSDIEPLSGTEADLIITVDPGPEGLAADAVKISVQASPDAADLSAPILPPPDEKNLYRAPFDVHVPMLVKASEPFDVTAELSTGTTTVKATGKVYASQGTSAPGGMDMPGFAAEADGMLLVRKAYFADTPAKAGVRNTLIVELELVGEQWHVYGQKVTTDEDVIGVPMTAEILPNGPKDEFRSVGPFTPPELQYHGKFTIKIPVTPVVDGPFNARLKLFWQACDPNMCLPFQMTYTKVSWNALPGDGTIVDPLRSTAPEQWEGPAGQSIWVLLLYAMLAGFIALVMPCTYPLIPITISFFTKQGEAREGKTTGLALAYGGGIVVVFGAIGAVVGLGVITGEQVLSIAVNPWVNGVFAALFLFFGLSLVGLYEINLPSSIQNLAGKAGSGGGYLSVFAMGTTLVITSFTCTAPFIGALLVYAATSGEWIRVTAAMGMFGLTMAVPFVFLSLSPKAMAKLPKSGIWMKHLKVVLGIIELGLVLKFLSNIDLQIGTPRLFRELFLVLWGASFLIAALYLMDIRTLITKTKSWKITRGVAIAVILLLCITAYLYTGLGGDPLSSSYVEAFLPNWTPPYANNFQAVIYEDYEEGIAKAKELNVPVFLHFTGFV